MVFFEYYVIVIRLIILPEGLIITNLNQNNGLYFNLLSVITFRVGCALEKI